MTTDTNDSILVWIAPIVAHAAVIAIIAALFILGWKLVVFALS
jgi:hypothetical protein